MSSKSSQGKRCEILRLEPVAKLSRQRTSCPPARSRSHKCEPKNPAPPVTRMDFFMRSIPRYSYRASAQSLHPVHRIFPGPPTFSNVLFPSHPSAGLLTKETSIDLIRYLMPR